MSVLHYQGGDDIAGLDNESHREALFVRRLLHERVKVKRSNSTNGARRFPDT